MKKAFANDSALKVISVVVAIIIWLYIIIFLDPNIDVTVRDLPIQFVGEEQLNANGLSVVNESATTLSLKVRGSRKKMGNNDMNTIIARVDVSEITQEGTASLPISVVVPFENAGVSSQNHYSVDVKTERLVEKSLNLEIETQGTLAENYMAGPITTQPSAVTIKGPMSVVDRISRAQVVLNYNGADVDIDQDAPIQLFDADGKELPALDAILSRISQSDTDASIHCDVVKLREIPIVPVFVAEEETGGVTVENLKYHVSPDKVRIYGDDRLTAKITSLQTEAVSLERLLDTGKVKVKVQIPEGVKILTDITEVEVSLEEETAAQTASQEQR